MSSKFSGIVWEKGSFRDPAGSVFYCDGEIYRTIQPTALGHTQALLNTSFLKNHMATGSMIPTKIVQKAWKNQPSPHILHHEKIPFVSYPYEWSFEMLKEAALTTLEILEEAINEGFILKDGSAWNLTFYKGKMCFFDILSIGLYEEGQVREGYGQFCQEFLYPLMLKSYKDINFQSIFKGSLKGILPEEMATFCHMRDWCKPGVLVHVLLNAKLNKAKTVSEAKIHKTVTLPKAGLLRMISNLKKIIQKMRVTRSSLWDGYQDNNTYKDEDKLTKGASIEAFAKKTKAILDLGCNTGEYSLLSARHADVYSCDLDSNCIDALFVKNKRNNQYITPFVMDLMNPSPNCGWHLFERKSVFSRLKVDGFLALALIHHLCIASNVPLEYFVGLLRDIAPSGVLEWVDKTDPMVQFLLRNRTDIFEHYNWEQFSSVVAKYFSLADVVPVNGGTRKLCLLKPLS